jgi:class 3 adenylate cyclase
MVAGGLIRHDETGHAVVCTETDPLHAQKVVDFAKAMLAEARNVRLPNSGEPVRMRVGIHSGPATSGVVGSR